MNLEERKEHLKDESLLSLRLDDYILPSLLQKLFKSMQKNKVVTLETTRVKDKLHSNFTSHFLDQYKLFKEGDKVRFTVSLFGCANTSYFYKLKVSAKLEYVQRLKKTAGEFFKLGNYMKAGKIYQKINGYYNFGDVANNFLKEDEEADWFKETQN